MPFQEQDKTMHTPEYMIDYIESIDNTIMFSIFPFLLNKI